MSRTPEMIGAESQNRTGDTAIFSRVLYLLSYLGPVGRRPIGTDGATEDSTADLVEARQGGLLGRVHRTLTGELAEAVDSVDDRRMGREDRARALLELLDRVGEIEVGRGPVRGLEDVLV